MKIKSLIISLIIFLTMAMNAQATQLPKDLKDYLLSQKKVPSIRYDGVVVYNSNVMYIPILPAYPQEVDKIQIVKTYPQNQKLDNFPDMILFNNNLALLKVIRVGEDTLTVRDIPEFPIEVKTGVIPQDLMVPRGLVLPESLAGVLGDVSVPLLGSAKTATFITGRKIAPLPTGKRNADTKNYSIPSALKDKLFFVNNFQTEYIQVYSASVTEPLYSLKTTGVIKDIKPVLGGKYLLAASQNKKNIDVIDVDNEYVSKHIDLTAVPSEIAVDPVDNKAYVASTADESLFVIDLTTMTMKEKIQLAGSPQRLSISSDGSMLAYLDMKTSNIYVLDLKNGYENKLITNYPNTTKLILKNNLIYMIARTSPKFRMVEFDLFQDNTVSKTKKEKKQNKLRKEENKKDNADMVTSDLFTVYDDIDEDEDSESDLVQNGKMYSTSIKDVNIGTKPVDMYEYNKKIYVLCAGDNTVYTIDPKQDKLTGTKLPVEGFSKSFTPITGSSLAVITNMGDLKYVVYDMDKEKAIQTLPISEYRNSITILDRKNGQ